MTHARHRAVRLSLLLSALLGLMSFLTTLAYGQEVKVLGAKLAAPSETASGSAHVEGNFLVPSQGLQILCANYTVQEGVIFNNGTAQGKGQASSCKTWVKGVENKGCKPIEPISGSGKGKMILHNGKVYLLGEPDASGTYGILKFNEETCALPPSTKITGTTVGECLTSSLTAGNCTEELVTHLVQQAPEALFPGDTLKFGLNTVRIDGIAAVSMTGANKGCKWSGLI